MTHAGRASDGAVIEVRGLRKRYGAREALAGVDLRVEKGEVVALLGPNGAGKTSVLEILEGYRRRDDGEVRVLGADPQAARSADRARTGIVLQSSGVEAYLTVREVLEMQGGWFPRRRATGDLLAELGLADAADARVRRLSGGQRRRLDLALALVGRPELLFLDEPTTGFDPGARRLAWDRIRREVAGGTSVLLTTHALDEAEALADRVLVLVAGRVVAEGSPAVLRRRTPAVEIGFRRPPVDPPTLGVLGAPAVREDRLVFLVREPTAALHALTGWALAAGVTLADLEVVRPSLEDVYLALAGGPEQS